jgi:phosphoenolpyruvate carboxykinase (ATP)
VLNPRSTWDDKAAYDKQARHLADLFKKNFGQFTTDDTKDLVAVGPQ